MKTARILTSRTITTALIATLTAGALSGCGVIDALNAVNDMKTSTQNMQGSTSQMDAKMDQTNQNMTKTNSKIDLTNANMAITNLAIHRQTLDIAVKDAEDPNNNMYIDVAQCSTTPTSILAAAEIFAETATADEIVKLTYAWLLDINTGTAPTTDIDPATHKLPQSIMNQFDLQRWIKYGALEAIAGFAPQDIIAQMVNDQITLHDRYEHTAYNVLWLRHAFISTFELDESLLSETPSNGKMDEPGMYEQALTYIGQLQYIEALPFRKKISIDVNNFYNSSCNIQDDLEKDDVKNDYYPKLKKCLATELDPQYVNPSDPGIAARMNYIKAAIDAGIAGQTPPAPIPSPTPAEALF